MVTFRNNINNNRRSHFRSNNNRRSHFRRNDEGSSFSNNDKFQRKALGGNNHNAAKLIEKYNDLAREALANEDKILSESYFQYADHFTRVLKDQENNRIAKADIKPAEVVTPIKLEEKKDNTEEKKNITKETEEKKSATS
ncbi:DUF4167 domain-containing protein [Candidatus Pelagibacter sp.]|nr:DUF4167 domain-containing protein [Candidatus Pelagibacter sp.]